MPPDAAQPLELPCPACGRTIRFRDEHRGKRVRCPGCGGVVPIPAADTTSVLELAIGPALSEAFSQTPVGSFSASASPDDDADDSRLVKRPVPRERPAATWRSLTAGAWTFSWRSDVVLRWAMLCGSMITTGLPAVLAWKALSLGTLGGIAIVTFGMAAVILAIFTAANLATCGCTIVEQTAYGGDSCEWPDLTVGDRIVPLFYFGWLVALSVTPGWLIGMVAVADTENAWLGGLIMLLSGYLLFPIWLLSTMQTGSAFELISSELLRAIAKNLASWIWFYVVSGAIGAALVAVTLAGLSFAPFLAVITLSPLLAAGGLTYFYLLGRLAWIMGQDNRKKKGKKKRRDGG